MFFCIFLSGLCPTDSYDEGVANMICDGADDLIEVLMKILTEKDETKKVFLITLFKGVEPGFLCILMLRMFTVGDDLGRFRVFRQ